MTRSPVPARTLRAVRALRARGLSSRKIAARLGVSHTFVLKRASNIEALDLDELEAFERNNVEREFLYVADGDALPTRCPTCGRRVAPPCLQCWLEERGVAVESTDGSTALSGDGAGAFNVALTGAERARYERIRDLKERKIRAGLRGALTDDELARLFGSLR